MTREKRLNRSGRGDPQSDAGRLGVPDHPPWGRVCVLVSLFLSSFSLFLATASATDPIKSSVLIRTQDVAVHSAADTTQAPYYTVSYVLPAGLDPTRVQRAILELVVDVHAKPRGEYVNEAPVLEVYALTQAFAGTVDIEALDRSTRAVRPVAVGQSRRVKIDVTRIVRAHAGGESNYGLVLGSVTGMREGVFTIRTNTFPNGGMARVTLYGRAMP